MAQLQARLEAAELRAALLSELLGYLVDRFAKLPERERPYFTPHQRFRILAIKSLLGWSAAQTAQAVLQCANTILNWERHADPASQTAGSCVKPTPPVRRAADSVRSLAQLMTAWGFGGADLVARTLARAGWKLDARSVRRYRKERTVPPPAPEPGKTRKTTPVMARFVHRTWMMDVSMVKRLFGEPLYIAAVFDAFSRVPLVVQSFERRPDAPQMARLFRKAVAAFTVPRHVITDLGGEFTGDAFTKAVRRLGIEPRTASADSIKATARLERFWLTIKQLARLRHVMLPLDQQELDERLARALSYYICFRPHEGLRGATPGEVFLGQEPAHAKAVDPPRARAGVDTGPLPFTLAHVGEGLPYLMRAA